MRESLMHSQPPHRRHEFPWSDTAVVVGVTLLSIILSDYFNLNEALYAFTRRGERFQLDELPIGAIVLLICLMWLSWRRYQQACREIRARRVVESKLADALAGNRQLAQETLRIQENERRHLARELHDELGQYLNAIKLDAVSIGESGGVDAEFSINASLAIIRAIDHVHRVVSDMIGRLRPVGLDELGLVAAIEHCVDQWRQRLPDTRFTLSVRGNFEGLSEPLNLTVYRLIQEGLTNIYRHAKAQQAAITLERIKSVENDLDELRLTVADDGCGIGSTTPSSRFGLSGMRERVEMAGGTFVLTSASWQGTRFEARLPAVGEPLFQPVDDPQSREEPHPKECDEDRADSAERDRRNRAQ
jgi:two-component system, NarL family, sensor histidine kinase UhpB